MIEVFVWWGLDGAVGALVAVVLLASVLMGPVVAIDEGDHIAYHANLFRGGTLTAVYVVVTLGCLLVSSHRFVVVYGALNLFAVAGLVWLTMTGFISLWCGWAAVTSLVIALHLRRSATPAREERPRQESNLRPTA